jgi:Uma2 family endonuclease
MLDKPTAPPVPTVEGPDGFPRRRFSVAEVEAMIEAEIIPPDEKFELIDGEIIPMSPKHHLHESIKTSLIAAIHRALFHAGRDDLRVGVETSVYLDDDTFVDPDVTVFPIAIRTDEVAPADLLLCVEIAVTTLRYDRDKKGPLYAGAGVPLYWLIDAETGATWIHADPKEGQWTWVRRVEAGESLAVPSIPGFAFRLADVR